MAKRSASIDGDDAYKDEGSSASKRARFETRAPEVIRYRAVPAEASTSGGRGGEDIDNLIDDEVDDGDAEEPDFVSARSQGAPDPRELDEEEEEAIRESIRAKSRLQGVRTAVY